MNIRTTKIPQPRMVTDYKGRFNIQTYGEDNLYPQHLRRIVSASGTATLCLNRYAKFIEGDGFRGLAYDTSFNADDTGDTLLHDICKDVAEFGGFALHVNYNIFGEVTDVHHVPFEHCRLEAEDDAGHVAHVKVSDNWSGLKRSKDGTRMLSDDDVEAFPVFNPEAVQEQIQAVGGIDKYKGQILWASMDGRTTYPIPVYDAAITEISTDEGLGNVKYRSVRNNFLVPCMLITKKGVPTIAPSGREITPQIIDGDDLRAFQGDENTSKIMLVELEDDEDEPRLVEFPVKNLSKEFETTGTDTVERIYAQFHQELFYAIRIGKLGFSGTVMRDAYEYYAGEVTNEQRFIERNFQRIIDAWHDVEVRGARVEILPLRYINSEDEA